MFLFALSRAEGHPRRLFRSLDRDGNRLPSDGRLRQVAPQFLPTSVRSTPERDRDALGGDASAEQRQDANPEAPGGVNGGEVLNAG